MPAVGDRVGRYVILARIGSGAMGGEYSFPSRFESGKGTNPEELIAAAHAGCFSMALSAELEAAGEGGHSLRVLKCGRDVHRRNLVRWSRA